MLTQQGGVEGLGFLHCCFFSLECIEPKNSRTFDLLLIESINFLVHIMFGFYRFGFDKFLINLDPSMNQLCKLQNLVTFSVLLLKSSAKHEPSLS